MEKIFLSAVTKEFGSTRRLIEPIVRRLGYEPVSMDNWTTAEGELIKWLRQKLDECVSVIHFAGLAYGAEPPTCNREVHGFATHSEIPESYSYTQFELLYARQSGKKTWVIEPGPRCHRDAAAEQIDCEDSLAHDDALRQQGMKKEPRTNYRTLLIRALRDLPEEFPKRFGAWQSGVTEHLESLLRRQKRIYALTVDSLLVAFANIGGVLLLFKDSQEKYSTVQEKLEDLLSSEYLCPWIATPPQTVDFVDCGRPQRGITVIQPSGLSGLDVPNEVTFASQRLATPQAAGNVPAAIQNFSDTRSGIVAKSHYHIARMCGGLPEVEKAKKSLSRTIEIYNVQPEVQGNTAQYQQSLDFHNSLQPFSSII